MLISQFDQLVPGQRLIQGGREFEIVKKVQGKLIGPYFLPMTFGGYLFTLKTKIAGSSVLCTVTSDLGDPENDQDWINGCDTLGRVWSPGESGDLTSE